MSYFTRTAQPAPIEAEPLLAQRQAERDPLYIAMVNDGLIEDSHVIGQSGPQPAEAATEVGADQCVSELGDEVLFWGCVIAGLCCFAAVIWFGPMGRTL